MPEHYPPEKRIFSKISLTPEQHIVLLKKRGLIFQDDTRACHYLRFIGYFRLSGYFIPFQIPGDPQHTFLPQTTFDQALQVYIFDRKLRLLVMDAVERIEVAIRTTISDVMGLAHGPHWYMDKSLFVDRYNHKKLINTIAFESGREGDGPQRSNRQNLKQNTFCKHYYEAYHTPEFPPIWMLTEILTMGNWSIIYKHLRHPQDKKNIADFYGIHPTLLISWLEAFTDLRNQCAHHGRIWNRTFTKKPKIPKNKSIGKHFRDNSRFYAHAAVLNILLKVISDGSSWQHRLAELIHGSPHISIEQMGFIANWDKDPFWGMT